MSITSPKPLSSSPIGSTGLWVSVLLLAVVIYTFGLGGQYIPTNGDELVYAHIARLTAASDQWLPLVSDLHQMRNTKPPLLFWQAMVAGDWGQHWTLAALRLPSLLYTLSTAALIAWAVFGISQDKRRALLAACIYLAFFSTFRYGRPYLTSAPETFWLCLPVFFIFLGIFKQKSLIFDTVIALKAIQKVAFLIIIGLVLGIGSTYKSFALIAPAAAAIWLALVLTRQVSSFKGLVLLSLQLSLSVLVAVGIFALWFVLDPDPAAVWREFVVGENVGKMSDKVGYWHEAVYGGGSSLWAQALAYIENAGLLAFLVVGLALAGFKNRQSIFSYEGAGVLASWKSWPPHVSVLLAWLLVWWLVFMLPSQRSARYVIPAMPALAIVMALAWHQIGRGWFLASGLLIAIMAAVLARIGWVMQSFQIATALEFACLVLGLTTVLVLLAISLAKPAQTRVCTLAASLSVLGCFSLTVAPLDGPSGRYSPLVQAAWQGKTLAVPSNFNAQWERFEFLLPGNRIKPFEMAAMSRADTSQALLAELLQNYDGVVWGHAELDQAHPSCRPKCHVVATRWVVKERHKAGDITRANLWSLSWLFSREWLLTSKP